MTRQGFIDFNTKLSPENSRKASTYAMTIRILDDYSVVLSSALQENEMKAYYDKHFGCIKGQKLTLPTEYLPSREFLAYHRDKVFVGV